MVLTPPKYLDTPRRSEEDTWMQLRTLGAAIPAIAIGFVWAANAAPAGRAEIRPTEGYLPQFTRTVKPATRDRVRLKSAFPTALPLGTWPVTFGVPFPRGALRSVENVRIVAADGGVVPAQIIRTATWDRPDGDVKWLLVDMTAEKGREYFLEYGADVRPVDEAFEAVQQSSEQIVVTKWPLRVAFSRRTSHLIERAWLDRDGNRKFEEDEQVLQARTRMCIVDHRRTTYETSDRPEDYKVEVETDGCRRVVIKASGWYRDKAGNGLCKYVTRAHMYAGQPLLRIVHTFIVGFDTDKTQIRDISVPFDLANGRLRGVTYPTETGFSAATIDAPAASHLVQDRADHFVVRDAQGKILKEGKRVGGWVDARSERGGLAVGLRNMWQEHQKELEATRQGIVAHLWPAHSDRPLDFRASSWLGPERYEKWGHRVYYLDFYRGGLDKFDQAMGLAKTNEIVLAFHGPAAESAATARAACAALEQPPLLFAEPAWMCRSDAFGPLPPRDPQRFGDIERKWDVAFGRYEFLREHIGNYGFFDYGDVNHHVTFDSEQKRWVQLPWRRMSSRFYGISVMPWIQFARTGSRRHIRWAIDNARHVMDIDMCHIDGRVEGYKYAKHAGGRYGGNGGIIHYGANIYQIGCDSHVSPWMFYYYLTGYRRAWDVLAEEGAYYLKQFARGVRLRIFERRMTTGALRTVLELWNATWDRRYLDYAHRLAELCYEGAAGNDGVVQYHDVYYTPALFMYYQATGDERMKALFLRTIRHLNEDRIAMHDPRGYSFYGPAMAYYLTADPSYLRRSVYWMQQYQEELNVGSDPLQRGVPVGRWEYCHNCLQLLYGPYLVGALATLSKPVEPAPDVSAGGEEIWLNNADGRAFTARVRWFAYARPFYWGVQMPNWGTYCKKHKLEGRVIVLDPQDRVAASSAMDFERHPNGAAVTLDVPAGRPGLYRIAREGAEAAPVRLVLLSSPLRQRVLPIQHAGVSQGGAYYFRVPDDMDNLRLRYKVFVLRKEVEISLIDPAGGVVKTLKRRYTGTAQGDWTTWQVPVPEAHRGKLWRFQVRPQVPQVQEVLLRIEGVPPVVSVAPESYFVPERIPEIKTATPRPAPEGVTTPIRTIAAGERLAIARGKKLGDKRYEHMNAEVGTIEFWLRPDWLQEDLLDSHFLRCGQLRVFRRSQLGTYIGLADATYQSAFLLRPGVWHHIAVVWELGPGQAKRALALLIDGVPLGKVAFGSLEPVADWTGPNLEIGANAVLHVTGLRISDTSRFKELQQGVLSPSPDDHTLYYEP